MPDIVSPIDGRKAYSFDLLDDDAVARRVALAQATARGFRDVPIAERAALCRGMLAAYARRLDENASAITRMMGKPIGQSRAEFERTMVERTEHLCTIAEAALADERLPAKPGFRARYVRHEPVGVVLDIAAWNYPLAIAVNVIVPAVLAGNAVLVKHASQTALVAEQFERAFLEAGAPEGLVQAAPMDHPTTARLIASRALGYVSFTGSVRGGHEIYRAVADQNFIPAGMELGGKDPALVLEDADVAFAAENLVDGAFYNAGQSCCGIERIYVVEPLYDAFVEAFVAGARQYVMGDPLEAATNLGPMVDAKSADFVRGQVAAARAAGARQLVGDDDFDVPDRSRCYVAPQVLVDVDHSMALMHEETFGPAIGIMKVANEAEGLALMNDSEFGLTASIWTGDAERGEALAEEVEAGTVYLNRCDYLDPGLAWTGVKDSGFGCSLSTLGFRSVTRPKSYHLREQPPREEAR
ncbi:MAG: aldehyde dehydrogenase family protein [Spirochaetaceae bacterium]|nr:aldehyde dehydrogenase family protein [Myxococcales bacterium]MCB9724650.1 aldehyde dehydrogenase family protein [Spirochaetaceae bacterium]